MIRLYDTMRRKKVELEPIAPGKIGIYVCGPTTYDLSHVGHARCYVAFDIVVRHLRYRGFDVDYVRNVTDVDDKIIARANEAGEDPVELAARMTAEYHTDMQALGNLVPDTEPRVSAHMDEIVALTRKLLEHEHAYELDGDVYFAVDSFPAYGALSQRNLDEQQEGARVDVDTRKRNPHDFALWKKGKPGEPTWPSPWGPGRPGWHIECSAMSGRYLGDTFDIHGGGMDLIFPHHENEIAQSRAAHGGATFARYWLHNGFINIRTADNEEQKMSKSLGNFFTIREVCQHHDAEALRLFLLQTGYRTPISFDVDRTGEQVRYPSIEEAEQRLTYGYTTLARLKQALAASKPATSGDVLAPADRFVERLGAAMDDDFNTAAALGHVAEVLTQANKLLDQPKAVPKPTRRRTLEAIYVGMQEAAAVLGTFERDPETYLAERRARLCERYGIDPALVEQKLDGRMQARAAKDYAKADAFRAELTEMGVEVMDAPGGGSTWRIVERS